MREARAIVLNPNSTMCLLTFAYDAHPQYALVFGGNRDEFYERPTDPASFWDEAPHVLAGRDRKEGGTWLGVTRNGYWGVVTNVRAPEQYRPEAASRGALVSTYLTEEPDPRSYATRVSESADRYNPFNLLVGTPEELYYVSGQREKRQPVAPGIHGLSNAELNTPWPKVTTGKRRLQESLNDPVTPTALLDLLDDRTPFSEDRLPQTGVGRELEKRLSPIFIEGEEYGTRSSTVLLIARSGEVTFVERTFNEGHAADTRRFSFTIPTGNGEGERST